MIFVECTHLMATSKSSPRYSPIKVLSFFQQQYQIYICTQTTHPSVCPATFYLPAPASFCSVCFSKEPFPALSSWCQFYKSITHSRIIYSLYSYLLSGKHPVSFIFVQMLIRDS